MSKIDLKAIAVVPLALGGYYIAQQLANKQLSIDYYSLVATLVTIDENCYNESKPDEFFNCPLPPPPPEKDKPAPPAPPPAPKGQRTLKHAMLWYAYQHPNETEPRQVSKEFREGKHAPFKLGHKLEIHVKKDQPNYIRWAN
jgi:hypothetical protein